MKIVPLLVLGVLIAANPAAADESSAITLHVGPNAHVDFAGIAAIDGLAPGARRQIDFTIDNAAADDATIRLVSTDVVDDGLAQAATFSFDSVHSALSTVDTTIRVAAHSVERHTVQLALPSETGNEAQDTGVSFRLRATASTPGGASHDASLQLGAPPPKTWLAQTGTELGLFVLLGAALVGGGLLITHRSRRRRFS